MPEKLNIGLDQEATANSRYGNAKEEDDESRIQIDSALPSLSGTDQSVIHVDEENAAKLDKAQDSDNESEDSESVLTNTELQDAIDQALSHMHSEKYDYRCFYENADKFDAVSKVTDILLD
jgi:hypothetical protein